MSNDEQHEPDLDAIVREVGWIDHKAKRSAELAYEQARAHYDPIVAELRERLRSTAQLLRDGLGLQADGPMNAEGFAAAALQRVETLQQKLSESIAREEQLESDKRELDALASRLAADLKGEHESQRTALVHKSLHDQVVAELREEVRIARESHAETMAAATARIAKLAGAMQTINAIRNSIIGAQTMNWSEHVYPLMSALDGAGYRGLGYEEARANVKTTLERIAELEAQLSRGVFVRDMSDEELWDVFRAGRDAATRPMQHSSIENMAGARACISAATKLPEGAVRWSAEVEVEELGGSRAVSVSNAIAEVDLPEGSKGRLHIVFVPEVKP